MKIALEIILATMFALAAILSSTKKFKALKQFTQSTRYTSFHIAMMHPFSSLISRTTGRVVQLFCYPIWRSAWDLKTWPWTSSFDPCIIIHFTNISVLFWFIISNCACLCFDTSFIQWHRLDTCWNILDSAWILRSMQLGMAWVSLILSTIYWGLWSCVVRRPSSVCWDRIKSKWMFELQK